MERTLNLLINTNYDIKNLKLPTSPTSAKRKSAFIRTPLLKSHSTTKIISGNEETTQEAIIKRRVSKLTEKQFVVVLEKAIEILTKPSEKRNLEEIFHLIKATEKLEFFARMKKDKEMEFLNPSSMNFKCCKALKYEYYEKGDTIFYQGDTGDKFYIVIKGRVAVLLLKDSKIIEKEKENVKNLRRNREIPEYMKKYLSPTLKEHEENKNDSIRPREKTALAANFQEKTEVHDTNQMVISSADVKRKLRKGISKISNALHFLKSIEKSSENTKTQASLIAFSPLKNNVIADLAKDITNSKEEESPIKNSMTLINPVNNKKCWIPGLDNANLMNKDRFFDNGVFKYNTVQTLKNGDVFGELAIIRKKKRAATIVCLENTHLAVLMKKDYESILLEQETAKFQKILDFFNKTLFKRCSNDRMTFIAYLYKKKKYVKDQIVFKEGQEPIECYIVKKGDVEISKNFTEENKKIKEKKKKKTSQKLKVAILSVGQFFGEEEILKNKENRKYTAKVISVKATLFAITKQNFKKILNEFKDISLLFKDQAKCKETFHSTKISQIASQFSTENSSPLKLRLKKPLKSRAPLRATLNQLDLFLNDNKKEIFQQIPVLAFQSVSNRMNQGSSSIRKNHEENATAKNLYHQETHQFTKVVRANQLTLKALLKKKINIFELYSETKNLHNPNDIKYMTRRERSKTQSLEQKSSIMHNTQNLYNLEKKGDSIEFLNVFTPIRKLSSPEPKKINCLNSPNAQNTNFIKTYEYFCDPLRKNNNNSGLGSYRTFSLSLKNENVEDFTKMDLCVRNNNNSKVFETIKENKGKFSFLEDDVLKRNNSNSIVVLNHMGKPIKFSMS